MPYAKYRNCQTWQNGDINMKKVLAIFLAVLMAFSMCSVALAADTQAVPGNYTTEFLSQIAATKKFYARVTSHSYENRTDSTDFLIYDDFNTNSICCNFKLKGIKALYANGEVKVVFTRFLSYLSASVLTAPLLGTSMIAVEAFQGILKKFVDDPRLNGFNKSVTTVERNGKTVTCEKFTGKALKVSGSFFYDAAGNLCEIVLTDTVGASIGFTLEDVSNTFDDGVFTVPFYYINLSVLWKILSIIFVNLGPVVAA